MADIAGLASGAHAQINGLAEKVSSMETKTGKPFVKLTIRDKTGAVECVAWDCSLAVFPWLKDGVVVAADGEASTYNDKLQFKISRFDPGTGSPDDYAKTTKFNVEELWTSLVDLVGSFTEPLTKYVAEEILLKHESVIASLKRAPAARGVHNAWYGGLLEHIWSLCTIGDPIIAHYQKHYAPKLSRDKVLFGLMLHDAGKIVEYDFSTPAFTSTNLGLLTNHMVLGPAWVYEKANEWLKLVSQPAAAVGGMTADKFKLERAHLMHVLAAHHGQIEWGSPVVPASLEAILVHHLDNLDAKMLHAWELVQGKPGPIAGFSEKSFIERTPFLRYD